MNLRIGLVCSYSLSVPGGVQAQVLGLARQLRQEGYETQVLGPCDGPPPEPFVTPLGNSLPTAANGSIAPLAPDPAATLRTYRALRDERFDVLHLHEPLAPGPGLVALIMRPSPIVATFHAAGRSTSYRLLRPLLKPLTEHIDQRVVVSKDALALVGGHLGGDNYEMLFNGVEVGRYRDAPIVELARPTVFFLGRHEERKGLGVLLAAIRTLPDDLTVWVAGTGPDTERLRREFRNETRIEWLGRISEEEKLTRMASASVFCAPSLYGESFGVVLLEAMAARTAVVASALDGYRNVATDEVDSLLIAPGDVDALAAVIHRVVNDDALTRRLIAAGSRRAAEFSMSELARRYVTIYQRIAQ